MEVYLLRHGETPWNSEKKIQGSTEWVDLSAAGVELAERTRDGLLAEGLVFDRVFSSPLLRALHTARIIGDGFGMTPQTDARLREMNFGKYEGTCMLEGKFADENIRTCFKDPPSFVPAGGESFDDLLSRAGDFIEKVILPLEGKVRRILVVSHGAFMRSFTRYVTGRSLKDYWQGVQPNCCVHVFDVSEGKISVTAMSRSYARPV